MGFDPSFRHWGVAFGTLSLDKNDEISIKMLGVGLVSTSKSQKKQVRVNSDDYARAKHLFTTLSGVLNTYDPVLVFSEIPSGSQSANAAKGLGIALGVLSSLDVPVIQVLPGEAKEQFIGKRTASKQEMIDEAYRLYPKLNWRLNPRTGKPIQDMEHAADAVASIHAGVNTPEFTDLRPFLTGL